MDERNDRLSVWSLWAMAFVGSPLLVTAGCVAGVLIAGLFRLAAPLAMCLMFALAMGALIAVWCCLCKKMADIPRRKWMVPILAAFIYNAGLWAIINAVADMRGQGGPIFVALTFPSMLLNLLVASGGSAVAIPIVQLLITVVSLCAIAFACPVKERARRNSKSLWVLGAVSVLICAFIGAQEAQLAARKLVRDDAVERVQDTIDLSDYHPFAQGNQLTLMAEKPSLIIDGDYPRLDGATAAYPVYASMAQGIYRGLDEETIGQYVWCSTTSHAYDRLIDGEVDVFFGAQPSAYHAEAAKENGLTLALLPIAKEAFVFFVHADNPIDSLSLDQIRAIYHKKVTNWSELGGKDEAILPFQRPENSGSQTIMLARIAGDDPLPKSLFEEFASEMAEVIQKVAIYRNYTSAIGYSFRFFATGMKPNDRIKLLSIDGIEPSIGNIRDGSYPFTVDVYAVTARPSSENTQKLLDWVVSAEGQDLIERCGYVRQ